MRMERKKKRNFARLIETLRPKPKSRFLSDQIDPDSEKRDLEQYTRHRVKVAYAEPAIDNKPPEFPLATYFNSKKLAEIQSRIISLDKENIELLKSLNRIIRTDPIVDCWDRTIPRYDKSRKNLEENERILRINREILRAISKVSSEYSRSNFLEEWRIKKRAIRRIYSHHLKSQFSIIGEPLENENPQLRVKCFFDIQIAENKENLGRIVFELYSDYVPKTCANFEALCRGTNGLCYKGTIFHRILTNYWCQGGDVTNFDGSGGSSIYGEIFEDENFNLKHAGPGIISMWNDGPNRNNSKFNIIFRKLKYVDGKRVVFGRIISGLSNLWKIEEYGTRSGAVLKRIIVANCGVFNCKIQNKR